MLLDLHMMLQLLILLFVMCVMQQAPSHYSNVLVIVLRVQCVRLVLHAQLVLRVPLVLVTVLALHVLVAVAVVLLLPLLMLVKKSF